jgi:hypothetical protein
LIAELTHKPRIVRVQQNKSSGNFSLNVPREIINECGWQAGTSVFFKVQDENKLTVEKVDT